MLPCVLVAQENRVVRKVRFEGNDKLGTSLLKDQVTMQSYNWIKKFIANKEPVIYTNKLYLDDLNRLRIYYQKEGYLHVQFSRPEIKLSKKNKVDITFHITEGEAVTVSDVSYIVDSVYMLDEVLPNRQLRNIKLQSKAIEEEIFRDEYLISDRLLIADEFYDIGFPYTIVDQKLRVDTASNSTNINWIITRGPLSYFGKTSIIGNMRIPDKSIRKQLNYEEGEIWSKKKIDITQDHIYNQGNYRVASVRTQMDQQQNDTLDMLIRIGEAPRWTTRFGVGYGREDKFRTFIDINYLGFLTHTGRLNFYAKHSGLEPYNLSLRFSQPSFLFPINTLVIYPFLLEKNEPGYRLASQGFNISFQQHFSKDFNTSIGFVFEDIQQDTTNVEELEEPLEETFYKKAGFIIGGIYSNAEPVLDPVQGYAISFNTKTNDILWGDEIPFYRLLAEYKVFLGLRNGLVLALKLKGGGVITSKDKSFIPVEEKFFAGGSHSVRGWPRSGLGPKDENGNPIGGNSLLESSAELRLDVARRLKLAFFVDAGNVWKNSFSYKFKDLHYAAGAGIRIKTAIGPAGIDVARPIFEEERSWQFHFNIGHTF